MSKEKRLSYSPNFKSSGIIYAKENGNGTAEKKLRFSINRKNDSLLSRSRTRIENV